MRGSFGLLLAWTMYRWCLSDLLMGRILVIEFDEADAPVYDEVMRALKRHPAFDRLRVSSNTISDAVLELPGLEIFPDRRKVFRDGRDISLTTKEYDLLCLLVENKGIVLTYEQIYQRVWGEERIGNESNAVGCHVRNLREKLYVASPDSPFTIRCVREVGYCLDVDRSKLSSN